MKLTFNQADLYYCWSSGQKMKIKNKEYRVGKMSYGDFFLEPGPERPETKPFNRGTKWLEIIDRINGRDIYEVSHTL